MRQAEGGTKPCRLCREPVHPRALACPHCGAWQRRYLIRRIVPAALVGILLFALFIWYMESWQREISREDRVPYDGRIRVTESHLFFGSGPEGPIVYVVGRMKNESDVAWEKVGLQAVFFNAEGRPIDAATDVDFPGTVLPRAEVAFKVSGRRYLPIGRYADHEVNVVEAEQVWRWP
jgi:hypothetical protein